MEEYGAVMQDSLEVLLCLLWRKEMLALAGDFKSREVNSQTTGAGLREFFWGAKLMDAVLQNLITQRVREVTRVRGN